MSLIFILLLGTLLPSVLSIRPFGEYYCINEGFFPRNGELEYMKYTSELKSSKDNYDDKKLFFTLSLNQKITHIGVRMEISKRSGQMWLKIANGVVIDNVCKVMDNMKNFMSCFSTRMNEKDCSLDKGTHKLANWSFEDDLKEYSDKMFYGQYNFSFVLEAFVEGKKEKQNVLTTELHMWANDVEYKQQPSKIEKKSKQGGSKSDRKKKKDQDES